MYFKSFPSFLYDFKYEDGTSRTEVVKDVTRNIRIKKDILRNITLYDEYDLTDGDTPEIIAEKFYGNPEYHWVVMLTNEKFDWLSDYPLTETEITKHIKHVYNPTLHSKDWYFDEEYSAESGYMEQRLNFIIHDSPAPFDPEYITSEFTFTISGQTSTLKFSNNFGFPDVRHVEPHNGLDRVTQRFFQIFPYPVGVITCLPSSATVRGTGTEFTTNLLVGMDLYTLSGVRIGTIKSITSDTELDLVSNSTVAITGAKFNYKMTGTPEGQLTITTQGRENHPVFFINQQGLIVNPLSEGAIPVSGDEVHRRENDVKRKIRLISPALLETVIKNYEEIL